MREEVRQLWDLQKQQTHGYRVQKDYHEIEDSVCLKAKGVKSPHLKS